MTLNEYAKLCHKIAKEKGFWDKKPNLPEKLMLIVSELGEACEALRRNIRQPKDKRTWTKDSFEDEIADTLIRIFDLAGYLGIDLDWQVTNKIKYNQGRSYKHGKAF